MRQVQLSALEVKLYQTTQSSFFPKITSTQLQSVKPANSRISPTPETLSFYETIKSNIKQPQKLSNMDIMSKIIKILKILISELEEFTKSVYLRTVDSNCLPGLMEKNSNKVLMLLDQFRQLKEELCGKSECSITPILARRFITRIIETLTIIKNRFGVINEPLTLQSMYRNNENSQFLKLENYTKLVGSLVHGIFQQFNFSKKNSNQEIVGVAIASIQNTFRFLQKFHRYVLKASTSKVVSPINLQVSFEKNRISSMMEKAYRDRSFTKKNKQKIIKHRNNFEANIPINPSAYIQQTISLYSGMSIDTQHIRSIIMQSKHHCVDIKDTLMQQNFQINKSIQQYSTNYQKWQHKVNRKRQKKMRKQKLLSSNTAINKLNCVKFVGKSEDKNRKKVEMMGRENLRDPKNINQNLNFNCKTNLMQKELKQCPSAPIRDKFKIISKQKTSNITRISFGKCKRNFLQVKPVTVTGDQFLYTNAKLYRESQNKDKDQRKQEKEKHLTIRDKEILDLVKGISKKNTNLLYRGFKVPVDRIALLRRKSTTSKNQRIITQ